MSDTISREAALKLIADQQKDYRGEGDLRFGAYAACADLIHAIRALPAAQPATVTVEAQAQAAADVLTERARQVSAEGWSADHDDAHFDGAIARAAASYALASAGYLRLGAEIWPWNAEWLKSTNQRRDLVKAGALILAEIERLDRALAGDKP